MDIARASFAGLAFLAAAVGTANAQQASAPSVPVNPTPGCSATPAQLEANKKVALAFFTNTGDARVALADPGYVQHNPVFKKRAADAKVSDYEEFKSSFGTAALAAQEGGA